MSSWPLIRSAAGAIAGASFVMTASIASAQMQDPAWQSPYPMQAPPAQSYVPRQPTYQPPGGAGQGQGGQYGNGQAGYQGGYQPGYGAAPYGDAQAYGEPQMGNGQGYGAGQGAPSPYSPPTYGAQQGYGTGDGYQAAGRNGYQAAANDAYSPSGNGYANGANDAYRPPTSYGAGGYGAGGGYGGGGGGYPANDAYSPGAGGGYGSTYSPSPSRTYSDPGEPVAGSGDAGYGAPYTPPPPAGAYEPRSGGAAASGGPGTFDQNEIITAGHGFFGAVSKNLASAIEYAFQSQGRPNGYILGEDAGGALVVGLRYGEGRLVTKDAGEHKVYWQGPSLGYDAGAEGSKTMVLVYNLRDPSEIYNRFGGVQGSAYFVGGVSVQFQTYNDVTLGIIRSGVGVRLGANIGYLNYTRTPTWNPL